MSNPIRLNCLVYGEVLNSYFEVKIDNGETFAALKQGIVRENPNTFTGIDITGGGLPVFLGDHVEFISFMWVIAPQLTNPALPFCKLTPNANMIWVLDYIWC